MSTFPLRLSSELKTGESGVRRTSGAKRTTGFLAQTSGATYMLEYIIATFVLVCPSRESHMVGLAGTVSELFAKTLFFHKTILCERSVDRKI